MLKSEASDPITPDPLCEICFCRIRLIGDRGAEGELSRPIMRFQEDHSWF